MPKRLGNNWDALEIGSRIDLDQIFDGAVWELIRGDDFSEDAPAFRTKLYNAAKRRGFKLRTKITDEGRVIRIQAEALGDGAAVDDDG